MVKKKTVSFTARKKVTRPVNVKFRTSSGQLVRFKAKKIVTKPVKVRFKARK